jgi:hypothetical protein
MLNGRLGQVNVARQNSTGSVCVLTQSQWAIDECEMTTEGKCEQHGGS